MMFEMPIVEAPRPEFGSTQRLPPAPDPLCTAGPLAWLFQRMPLALFPPVPPLVPQAGITTAATRATSRPVHTQARLFDIVLTPLARLRDSNIQGRTGQFFPYSRG